LGFDLTRHAAALAPEAAEPIARLRRLAAGRGDVSDHRWFAEGIRLYESAAPLGVSLARCLELEPGRGETSWWEREARTRRDEALCGIARQHLLDLKPYPAAVRIVDEASSYETGEWRHHKKLTAPPTSIDPLRAWLFRLLKITGTTPSVSTVYRVLSRKAFFVKVELPDIPEYEESAPTQAASPAPRPGRIRHSADR
jgi:hypothetical protein